MKSDIDLSESDIKNLENGICPDCESDITVKNGNDYKIYKCYGCCEKFIVSNKIDKFSDKKLVLLVGDTTKTKEIIINVRWWDGYLERFTASEVRFGSDLLWMRLIDGNNRHIPLRNVRWFSTNPESHEIK